MTRSLVRGEQAVGHADAHHEVLGGLAFAVGAAGDAEAVALGVDAPPLEVETRPTRAATESRPSRANSRTSSQASQGFLASLRRSDLWALVSLTGWGVVASGAGMGVASDIWRESLGAAVRKCLGYKKAH